MRQRRSPAIIRTLKMASLGCLMLSSLAFCYFEYEETDITPRASAVRTAQQPEYVHERFQKRYFSAADAQRLRQIHLSETSAFLAIVFSSVLYRYARQREHKRAGEIRAGSQEPVKMP